MYIGWQKLTSGGPGLLVVSIIVNYCCTRDAVRKTYKKRTETEETIFFFVTFLSLDAFQLKGRGWGRGFCPPPPLAMPMQ